MQNFTQIALLWGPVILAIVAIIVVALVVGNDTKNPKKSEQPHNELDIEPETELEPELEPEFEPEFEPEAEPAPAPIPAPVKREPAPPSVKAKFKVFYTTFDDSEAPALLSLQGDLVYGTLRTGDFVHAENSKVKVKINCMSDYGNHIASEITKLDDCVVLIETTNPNYIQEGEMLIKD